MKRRKKGKGSANRRSDAAMEAMPAEERIFLINIQIDNLTMRMAVERIEKLSFEGKGGYVVTPNADHIVTLDQDPQLARIYREASLTLCDSQILMWIARLQKTPLLEKVSGSDLLRPVCKMAADRGRSVFFLGSSKDTLQKAAARLQTAYPGLRIAGWYSPPFGFEKSDAEAEKAADAAADARPDILFLFLGTPKQEKFYWRYKNRIGVHVALCLGASADFEAGNKKRAPKWVSRCGLEWFFRFLTEPRRLFKRYFISDIRIFRLLWKAKRGKK